MAGFARNIEERMGSSVAHLREMARENDVQLEHHRRLHAHFSDINTAVRDGYEHVVPALDQRRAKFAKDYEFRQRVVDERYDLISSSRGDPEAVPFTALGMDAGSPERERKAAAKKKMHSALAKLKGVNNVLAALGGGGGNNANDGGGGTSGGGGLLGMLRRANAPPPKEVSNVKAKDLMGKTRKKESSFHDGKASAALARVQERRDGEAARAAARAAREEAVRREKMAEARKVREEEEALKMGKSRAVLSKMRKAGSAVVMGSRVGTAIDDNSTEATAARDAERLAVAAVASVADAAAALGSLAKEAADAAARLETTRGKLAEADVAAAAAGGFAARAEEIVADLRAGRQEDAAECATQTVEAWRARADAIAAEADALRGDCDALEETVEVVEGQVAAAAARLEEETQKQVRARRDAAQKEVAADDARAARAHSLTSITKDMLKHFRAVEASKGGGAAAAAAAAAEAGVKADPAESFAADLDRAVHRAAEVAAASLTAAADARKAEAGDGAARGVLAAAQVTADEAQEQLRAALGEVYAAAGGAVLGCEATLTHDATAQPGRRLAAIQGPPTMSPAFSSGATLKRLKPGFNLLVAVKGGGGRAGAGAAPQAAKPPLSDAPKKNNASDTLAPAPAADAAPKKMSLFSLVSSVAATKKAANAFGGRKSAPTEELPSAPGGLPPSLASIFPSVVPPAPREGEYDLGAMSTERAAASAAAAAFKRKLKLRQQKAAEGDDKKTQQLRNPRLSTGSMAASDKSSSSSGDGGGGSVSSERGISAAAGGPTRRGSRQAAVDMMSLVKDTAGKAAAARKQGLVHAAAAEGDDDNSGGGGGAFFSSVFKPLAGKSTASASATATAAAKLKAAAATAAKGAALRKEKRAENGGGENNDREEAGDGGNVVTSAAAASAAEKTLSEERAPRASYANAEEVRKRLRVAVEQYIRLQQSTARAEESVHKALDAAVTAHGFASLKRREAVAFANAAELAEVRRATVERVARRGIETVADAAPGIARIHTQDPGQAVIAMLRASAEAYAAAAAEAEAAAGERRAGLERATAAAADAERAAAAAHDVVAEVEAAERIARDAEAAARETTDDAASSLTKAEAAVNRAMMEGGDMGATGVAVAEAEVAREVLAAARADEKAAGEAAAAAAARVEDARRDRDASAAPVAAAHDAREGGVRVLLVVEEEQERARQRQSAAATAMEVGAESEHLVAAARDAAEEAAVSGASKTLIKLRAFAAAVSASKTVASAARERAAAAASAAATASATVIAVDADVASRHAELDARKAALARAMDALARAQDSERHDAAIKRKVEAEARKKKQVEALSAKWLGKVRLTTQQTEAAADNTETAADATTGAEAETGGVTIRTKETASGSLRTADSMSMATAASTVWRSRRWAQGAKDAVALVLRMKWTVRFPGVELEDLQADPELAAAFNAQLLSAVRGALMGRGGARSAEAVVAALRPGSVIVELVAHSVVHPYLRGGDDGDDNAGGEEIDVEDLIAVVRAVAAPERLVEDAGDGSVLARDQFTGATAKWEAVDARVAVKAATTGATGRAIEGAPPGDDAAVFETLPEVDDELMVQLSAGLERLGLVAFSVVATRRAAMKWRDRVDGDGGDGDNAPSSPSPNTIEEGEERGEAVEAWNSPTFAPPPPVLTSTSSSSSPAPAAAATPEAAAVTKKKSQFSKFRSAGRLVKAAVAFITPAQRAAAEVAALRREVVAAARTLDGAEEEAAAARRDAKTLQLRSKDAQLAAAALAEKAEAVQEQSDEAAVDVQAAHAAATQGGATPLAEAMVREARAETAVTRGKEGVAAAARTAAAAHDDMEATLVAVAEAEAVVEAAKTELRRRRSDGELKAAEGRLAESRATAGLYKSNLADP
jgi:hypothetical protein